MMSDDLTDSVNIKNNVIYNPIFATVPYRMGLYPVVDGIIWIKRLLDLGVKTIQLRLKAGDWDTLSATQKAQVTTTVKQAIALGRQYQARLFINDYWQLAIQHGAYGVHLGQEDIQSANLDAIADAGLRLGISTHHMAEVNVALGISPSYIALGHIFATQTKDMPSSPQGLVALEQQVKQLGDYPTVAIGGIDINKVPQVLMTGVPSIAAVSAITQADDWQKATCQLLKMVGAGDD